MFKASWFKKFSLVSLSPFRLQSNIYALFIYSFYVDIILLQNKTSIDNKRKILHDYVHRQSHKLCLQTSKFDPHAYFIVLPQAHPKLQLHTANATKHSNKNLFLSCTWRQQKHYKRQDFTAQQLLAQTTRSEKPVIHYPC